MSSVRAALRRYGLDDGTRIHRTQSRAYVQLLAGLAVLALTVCGAAIWLGRILFSWSRKLTRLEAALVDYDSGKADLPPLPLTGERELERLVGALNIERGRAAPL